MLSDFGFVEKSLSDIEDKVQNNTEATDDLKAHLLQVGLDERMPQLHFVSWH